MPSGYDDLGSSRVRSTPYGGEPGSVTTKLTTQRAPSVWPGLAVTGAAIAVSTAVAAVIPAVSTLTLAVGLGVAVGNLPRFPSCTRPGLTWATRRLLRTGVVLLGLQLAVGDIVSLGIGTIVAVLAIVLVTFAGTVGLGRMLGVSPGLSVLVGTGFSVCGASAIAAMEGVIERDDEDVATAVAMVTIFGTLAMLLLPLVSGGLGFSALEQGRLAGGAVHEVAQVVAAASPAGAAAVAMAVVVKLSRVVLLAPMVAIVSVTQRRRSSTPHSRPPILPLFVAGFLVAMVVRSTGVLPEPVLAGAKQLTTLLLAGALFALGSAVRLTALLRTGARALALGACSTVLVTVVAFVGLQVLTSGS